MPSDKARARRAASRQRRANRDVPDVPDAPDEPAAQDLGDDAAPLDLDEQTAQRWFVAIYLVVTAELVLPFVAALVAGPGIFPGHGVTFAYNAEIVRRGVFILAGLPLLDVGRQLASARAHRHKRYARRTGPLNVTHVVAALGASMVIVVVGMVLPWLVVPVFVILLAALFIAWLLN